MNIFLLNLNMSHISFLDSYGRGRGRGRWRGRSWGRGGYGNYQGIVNRFRFFEWYSGDY